MIEGSFENIVPLWANLLEVVCATFDYFLFYAEFFKLRSPYNVTVHRILQQINVDIYICYMALVDVIFLARHRHKKLYYVRI